ncbi:MAG: SRPBCC family protein [Planctomycetota bacterium]
MKILKYALIALAVLVLGYLVAGLAMSGDYVVERSITIDAPAAKVYPAVADLGRWPEWAVWWQGEEKPVVTPGETMVGVGASQSWTMTGGNGDMKITKADPKTGVKYDFAMVSGDQRQPADGEIKFIEKDGKTEVIWTMSGNADAFYFRPMMATFGEYKIGSDFAAGLANLKKLIEKK